MKSARQMSHRIVAEIVDHIQQLLWLDIDGRGDFWNPDKAWYPDTLDRIAAILAQHGLRPARRVRAQPIMAPRAPLRARNPRGA